jgi:hypothetical protein
MIKSLTVPPKQSKFHSEKSIPPSQLLHVVLTNSKQLLKILTTIHLFLIRNCCILVLFNKDRWSLLLNLEAHCECLLHRDILLCLKLYGIYIILYNEM